MTLDIVGAKKALLAVIAAAVKAAGETGVQVAYAWPGRHAERECVHGGRADWDETSRGLGRGDQQVTLNIEVHTVIAQPNASIEETDTRASQIGRLIAAALADDDTLGGYPGVLAARVAGGDLDHGSDDDGSTSVLTQRIALDCYHT